MKVTTSNPRIRDVCRCVTLLAALTLMPGCKADPEPATPAPAALAVDPRPDVLAPGETCDEDGRWKPCTVLDRMERAGLGAKALPADTTRVSFLSPEGLHFSVGKSGLLIAFYYQDSLQAKREWARLDTFALVPPGDTSAPWPSRPSTLRAANLIAAFFGSNATQTERVQLLFQGGLPAPRP